LGWGEKGTKAYATRKGEEVAWGGPRFGSAKRGKEWEKKRTGRAVLGPKRKPPSGEKERET